MTEPEYTYVKGKGWIVLQNIRAKSRDGKWASVYDRVPENGECFTYISNAWKNEDGSLNMKGIIDFVGKYTASDWSGARMTPDRVIVDRTITVVFDD